MDDWRNNDYFSFQKSVGAFLKEDDAPAAIEYAIMASLIAAVIVGVVASIGQAVISLFEMFPTDLTP